MRDEVTSSLAIVNKPPVQFADDLELALARRRSRKISTNSMATFQTSRSDSHKDSEGKTSTDYDLPLPIRRPRADSRSNRRSMPPPVQRATRDRSGSSVSLQGKSNILPGSLGSTSSIQPSTSPEGYQRALEHVVSSRLVETFLSLSLVIPEEPTIQTSSRPASPLLTPSKPFNSPRRTVSATGTSRTPNSPRKGALQIAGTSRGSPPIRPTPLRSVSPNDLVKSKKESKQSAVPHSSPRRPGSEKGVEISKEHALPTPAPSPPTVPSDLSPAPFYISPFHRPSTNPGFSSIDVHHDFAPWIDLSLNKFQAAVWGRVGTWGKGAEQIVKASENEQNSSDKWSALAVWDVDMDELLPLPSEVIYFR